MTALGGIGLGGCGAAATTDQLVVAYDKLLGCEAAPDALPATVQQFFNAQIVNGLAQTMALHGSGFTASQINACAAAFAQITCDQLVLANPLTSLSACNPAGTLADGSACSQSVQCQSGLCSITSSLQCGACQHLQAAGQACTAADQPCGAGLSCVKGTCVAMAAAGAACGQPSAPDCQSPLLCVNNTCAALTVGKAGDACSSTGTAICGLGLSCQNKICVALLRDGQACGTTTAPCSAFSFCSPATSTCTPVAAAALGAPCGATGVIGCLQGYCAASGVCAPLLANGQACSDGNACQSAHCANQVCAAPLTCPAQ